MGKRGEKQLVCGKGRAPLRLAVLAAHERAGFVAAPGEAPPLPPGVVLLVAPFAVALVWDLREVDRDVDLADVADQGVDLLVPALSAVERGRPGVRADAYLLLLLPSPPDLETERSAAAIEQQTHVARRFVLWDLHDLARVTYLPLPTTTKEEPMKLDPEKCADAVARWSPARHTAAEVLLGNHRAAEDCGLAEALENLEYARRVVDLHTLVVARIHNRACDAARKAAREAAVAASWESRCAGLPAPVWAVPAPRLANRRVVIVEVANGQAHLDVEGLGVVAYNLRRGWAQTAWSAADGQLDVEVTIKAWREFCAKRRESARPPEGA